MAHGPLGRIHDPPLRAIPPQNSERKLLMNARGEAIRSYSQNKKISVTEAKSEDFKQSGTFEDELKQSMYTTVGRQHPGRTISTGSLKLFIW